MVLSPGPLVVGADLGLAAQRVRTTTKFYDFSYFVQGDEIGYTDRRVVESQRATGADLGFTAKATAGIDLGYFLKWEKLALEITGGIDFVRRGEREEFYFMGGVRIRPQFR